MNIFQNAALKLTVWYLGLLMLISLSFSVAFYRVSVSEIDRGLARQASQLRSHAPFELPQFMEDVITTRTQQLEESRNRVITNLVYFNVTILLTGGVLSYLLARRTLLPIEQSLEGQRRFTADAAHELRTPLTAMRTEIEVALRDTSLSSKEMKELLQSNLEEVRRLDELSNRLLTMAGLEGSANPIPKKRVDTTAELAIVLDRLASKAKLNQVSLQQHQEPVHLTMQEGSFSELLTILVDNAIKYSKPHTEVVVTVKPVANAVQLVVRDAGIGISDEQLPRLFERFYRADASRNKGVEGYGLGLAIAKSIVDTHNGTIVVASQLGEGTTMTVTLPNEVTE